MLRTTNSPLANMAEVNNLGRSVRNDQQVRIIKDQTGTPVVLLDKSGLKTTAVGGGVDVTTATDGQLTFNSNRNTLKIIATDDEPIFVNAASTTTYTIPHHQTYAPIALVYIRTGTSFDPVPVAYAKTRDDINHVVTSGLYIEAYTDATNLYIVLYNSLATRAPTSGTYGALYYLLQETAGT